MYFQEGQRVFGEAEYGSLCEYTAVRAELLLPIPNGFYRNSYFCKFIVNYFFLNSFFKIYF